jgi:sec-independent protein translocase protein TatA
MLGFGLQELVIVLLIALVIFGAKKLPEISRGLGEAIRDFRKGVNNDDPEDAIKEAAKKISKQLERY